MYLICQAICFMTPNGVATHGLRSPGIEHLKIAGFDVMVFALPYKFLTQHLCISQSYFSLTM